MRLRTDMGTSDVDNGCVQCAQITSASMPIGRGLRWSALSSTPQLMAPYPIADDVNNMSARLTLSATVGDLELLLPHTGNVTKRN